MAREGVNVSGLLKMVDDYRVKNSELQANIETNKQRLKLISTQRSTLEAERGRYYEERRQKTQEIEKEKEVTNEILKSGSVCLRKVKLTLEKKEEMARRVEREIAETEDVMREQLAKIDRAKRAADCRVRDEIKESLDKADEELKDVEKAVEERKMAKVDVREVGTQCESDVPENRSFGVQVDEQLSTSNNHATCNGLTTPVKECTPTPLKERTPTPLKERTPTPLKERIPTPVKERTSTPIKPKRRDINEADFLGIFS